MARRLLPFLLLLALGACGSSVAASSSDSSHGSTAAHCGPAGAHTLAATELARVYSLRGFMYGCAGAGSKSYRLGGGKRNFREQVGPVALAGEVVAYGLGFSGVDTREASVIVRRLTDGKELRDLPATTKPLGPEFFQSVDAIVVKSDGAVAWIGSGGSIIGRYRQDIEVDKADKHGQSRLDSGTAIRVHSLRLRGSALSWHHGTAVRSATLD